MAARGGTEGKGAPPIRRQMHASSHVGGGFLCSAGPQQVKGGTGLVGNVERGYDLARPGSWHEPIHAEDAPLKTRSLKKLPPKTHSSRLEAQDH